MVTRNLESWILKLPGDKIFGRLRKAAEQAAVPESN